MSYAELWKQLDKLALEAIEKRGWRYVRNTYGAYEATHEQYPPQMGETPGVLLDRIEAFERRSESSKRAAEKRRSAR